MTAAVALVVGNVTDRGRKQRILRRRFGPPPPVEEPRVPDDLSALGKRREPLFDRLEKIRDSSNLQLSEWSRNTIDEALAVLRHLGWGDDL